MSKSSPADNQSQDTDVYAELHTLTATLQTALHRFSFDSRLLDMAETDMPDARGRLEHVLQLTEVAAHRTLDLVEQSCPPADRTAQEAAALMLLWRQFRARVISTHDFHALMERMDTFLHAAETDSRLMRTNLAQVLLAQGYQDLTGQIIRGVIRLVAELETALNDLTRLSRRSAESDTARDAGADTRARVIANGASAVVNDQQDVDDLLSGLGM